MFNDWTCLIAQARVEVRLSATGLIAGEFHVNAEAVENVHDRLTSLRVERIDETCHKELHSCHRIQFYRLSYNKHTPDEYAVYKV